MSEEKKAATPDSITDKSGKSVSGSNNTNAILCWIFTPITSLIWMNDADENLRWHAKQTLYFGLASIGIYVIGFIVISILTAVTFGCASILYCLPMVWSVIDIVVRIMGALKASKGEKWEVPVISQYVK